MAIRLAESVWRLRFAWIEGDVAARRLLCQRPMRPKAIDTTIDATIDTTIDTTLGVARDALPLAGIRVLLAEHRPGWSSWLYCALRGNGIDVVEVLGTAQLERALDRGTPPSAAIVDVALPAVMYGEFVDVLRERAPRLPVLFVAPTPGPLPAAVVRVPAARFVAIPEALYALRHVLLVEN